MNEKNNDNNNIDKEIEKKEEIIKNNFDEKEKKEKDNPTEKKDNENNEDINKDVFINNNIIPLDEEKQKKEEEKKIEKTKSKKEQIRRVPIKDWPCRSLNEYQINMAIGEGTYGIVYQAKHIGKKEYESLYGIPDLVALKQIKTANENEGFPITALREIMILKKLDHKNILKLLEVVVSEPKKEKKIEEGKINRDVYLVFEYMKHDLCGIIHKNVKYDLSQIKYIFHELVLGLKYLHENNILHRDLKPSNILVNEKNEIKIGDFGLARIFSDSQKPKRYTNQVMTVCYRAPEIFLGETNYSTKIDIWSLGCILLELLTRKITFNHNDEKMVFLSICHLCGIPTKKTWPNVNNYKNYKLLIPIEEIQKKEKEEKEEEKEGKKKKKNLINNQTFPNLDDVTLDIIDRMLTLNPDKRITLDEILKHPFLTSHEPKMCKPEDMPKMEASFNALIAKKDREKSKNEMKVGANDYLGKKKKK